jgi:hypothetical protein
MVGGGGGITQRSNRKILFEQRVEYALQSLLRKPPPPPTPPLPLGHRDILQEVYQVIPMVWAENVHEFNRRGRLGCLFSAVLGSGGGSVGCVCGGGVGGGDIVRAHALQKGRDLSRGL